jgi:hypothetical protein
MSTSRKVTHQTRVSPYNHPSADEYSKTDSYKRFYSRHNACRCHRNFAWADWLCRSVRMDVRSTGANWASSCCLRVGYDGNVTSWLFVTAVQTQSIFPRQSNYPFFYRALADPPAVMAMADYGRSTIVVPSRA